MNKQQRAKFWCQVRCQSAFTGLLIILDDWWMTMTRNDGLLCSAGNSQIIKSWKPLQCGQWFSLRGMRGGLFVCLLMAPAGVAGTEWEGRRIFFYLLIAGRSISSLSHSLNNWRLSWILAFLQSFYIFSSFFCWWQASCIFCRAQRVGSKL